jgi:hypothetical protein
MLARLLLLLASALVAGCAATPAPARPSAGTQSAVVVALRTWAPPSPVACPEARTEGILARQPQSGAGLRDNQGAVSQVIWPTDYTARDDGGRLVVLDGGGNVIAHEGDRVEIGGQDVGGGTWLGCGGMRLMTP